MSKIKSVEKICGECQGTGKVVKILPLEPYEVGVSNDTCSVCSGKSYIPWGRITEEED